MEIQDTEYGIENAGVIGRNGVKMATEGRG